MFVCHFKFSRMVYCQCTECPSPTPGRPYNHARSWILIMDNVTCYLRNEDERLQNKAFTDGVDERVQNRQHEYANGSNEGQNHRSLDPFY